MNLTAVILAYTSFNFNAYSMFYVIYILQNEYTRLTMAKAFEYRDDIIIGAVRFLYLIYIIYLIYTILFDKINIYIPVIPFYASHSIMLSLNARCCAIMWLKWVCECLQVLFARLRLVFYLFVNYIKTVLSKTSNVNAKRR